MRSKIKFVTTNMPVYAEVDYGYLSLRRLKSYTYELTFDKLSSEKPIDYPISGACTSFVKDGKLYRNLDWDYSHIAEFLVVCKGFKGMALIPGVKDSDLANTLLLSQMPYHINDGVNEDGIMVSSHVLYNDWNFKGSGKKNVPLTKIPFIILSKLHSIDDISMLQEYLDNIQVNNYLKNAEYLMQYLVTDGTTSYVISPSENGYEIIDISELPQLANFKWLNKAEIDLSDPDLQLRPTGVERWNLIASNPTLEDLRFTKAYESDDRLSEFIGINHTTKESSEDDLRVIYQKAHNIYVDRERDGKTWQTVHSVVYSSAGIEELYTQENYRYKVI